jgi:hypothetical protein
MIVARIPFEFGVGGLTILRMPAFTQWVPRGKVRRLAEDPPVQRQRMSCGSSTSVAFRHPDCKPIAAKIDFARPPYRRSLEGTSFSRTMVF